MVDSSSQTLYANEAQDDTWFDAQNVMRCLYPKMKWTHIAFNTGMRQHTIGPWALTQNSTMVSSPAITVAESIHRGVALEAPLPLFLGPPNRFLKQDRQQLVLLEGNHQLQRSVHNSAKLVVNPLKGEISRSM